MTTTALEEKNAVGASRPGATTTATPSRQPLRGLLPAWNYAHFFLDPITCMRRLHRRYGPIVGLDPFDRRRRCDVIAIGPHYNRLVIGNPDLFRTTGQMLYGPKESAQRRLRHGLTRMTGEVHRRQRQLVMPPFQKKAVEGYRDSMAASVAAVVENWRPGRRYDLYREMRELALRVSSAILFSPDPRESLAVGRMIGEWMRRNFSPPVIFLPLDAPMTPYRRMLEYAERLERRILSLIARCRDDLAGGRADVLSILVRARGDDRQGMTDAELVGQYTILFAASYETTAATLTWTLFLLEQHPHVLADLVDELHGVLRGDAPTPAQLPRLPLLDRVIRESMRVIPPVPYTIRAATAPTELGGYFLPRGSRAICSHFMTHHLPELYPQPERFLPERWASIDPSPYEYLPFSAGPRMCLGVPFAIQAISVAVAMIVQRYRVELLPDTRVDRTVRVTMFPRAGIPARIVPQDRAFRRTPVRGNVREMVDLD